MSPLTGRARLAWALCGVGIVLAGVHTWLFIGWSEVRSNPSGWPVLTVGLPLWGVLGAMIVTRWPRHRVGWLFIAGAVLSGLANCLACYDLIATSGPSPDPSDLWPWAVWLAIFLDVPEPLMFLILVFLLFPTGHLPSPRWRPLLWASWLSFGGFVVLLAVVVPPWRIEVGNRDELFDGAVVPILLVMLASMLVELLAAAASVVVRMRRSTGLERQQLRWLAVPASMVAVSFVLAATLPVDEGVGNFLRVLPLHLSVVAVVAGAALAILRYRLYDLDVVISRAIILTASTAVVAAGYIALVVVVGGMPGRDDRFWPSLLATAAVALAFQPLRRRIVRFADRMAFGPRAAPYEALADLGRNLQQAPGTEDLLRNVAQAVSDATGARRVTCVLELPGGREVSAAWPPEALASHVPTGSPTAFAVTDGGDRLGRVEVVLPPGRELRPAEVGLVERLIAQTALAMRNLRLETELAGNVAELHRQTVALRDSRRALVVAGDEEKSRFAAALHRGVLPHLAPLPGRLETAADRTRQGLGPIDLQAERDGASTALDELRRLVSTARPSGGQRAAADQTSSSRSGPNADLVT